MEDVLAIWFQATNDGSGWKLEKKPRPTMGDYLHSEFRRQMARETPDVEAWICTVLSERDGQGKTAVCRLARDGQTLDCWRQRTIGVPVTAAVRGQSMAFVPGQQRRVANR